MHAEDPLISKQICSAHAGKVLCQIL